MWHDERREYRKAYGDLAKMDSKPSIVQEFDSIDDWLMSSVLVALLRSYPDLSDDEIIQKGKDFAKKLYMPNTKHLWRNHINLVHRLGLRSLASRIRRELFSLL